MRTEAWPKMKGGWRSLEWPGANPLKDAHAALAAAVFIGCGFHARKDLPARLERILKNG